MSLDKKDFYGKEVTEAIKNACDSLGVAQEKLEIEVVETGSTGIFGLIRRKAHIRVVVKPDSGDDEDMFEMETMLDVSADRKNDNKAAALKKASQPKKKAKTKKEQPPKKDSVEAINTESKQSEATSAPAHTQKEQPVKQENTQEQEPERSEESLALVKEELLRIVELMGFPSTLEITSRGLSVDCTLRGEFEENLTGPDGKVLDSLQYILRKVVSKQTTERLRISVDVGDFREKRLENLKSRAIELASQVKEDGKTQALPALNPAERRAIHVILQDDKEIRSRSVGDGLFKKILIYKAGKSNRSGGRRRSGSKGGQGGQGRQGRSSKNQNQKSGS